MNERKINIETVKNVLAYTAKCGAGFATSGTVAAIGAALTKNKLMRLTVAIGAIGLGRYVGDRAEAGIRIEIDDLVNAICDLKDAIKVEHEEIPEEEGA